MDTVVSSKSMLVVGKVLPVRKTPRDQFSRPWLNHVALKYSQLRWTRKSNRKVLAVMHSPIGPVALIRVTHWNVEPTYLYSDATTLRPISRKSAAFVLRMIRKLRAMQNARFEPLYC